MREREIKRKLVRAAVRAFLELNTIRARDGVPWTHQHHPSDVDPEYFSSVIDMLDEAVIAATNKSAHCHPELYTDSLSEREPVSEEELT